MNTVMSTENWLAEKFNQFDWFHSIGKDNFNYPVLYVKYLDPEVLNLTSSIERDFKVHYASSLTLSKDNYVKTESIFKFPELSSLSEVDNVEDVDDVDIHQELWNLQRICGRDNLENIFYEKHDDLNAITDYSLQYPEIRNKINSLYEKYGFDVIYDYFEY